MKIHLHEIPEEGKSWVLSRQTSELNAPLQDLIGQAHYQLEFTITPMDASTFQITGFFKTEYPDDCSKCGDTIPVPINFKFRDLLMPQLDQPRNSHYSRSNHVSDLLDGSPEVFNYEGNVFLADEYFHEKLAIEQPTVPMPPCDNNGECSFCHKRISSDSVLYDESIDTLRQNPFEGLKQLKLK